MINQQHSSQYRVYVEDTDLMGIIYHGKYLYFFERARTDLLRANGISLTKMAEYDTYFAIRDIHIRYLSPGKLDDMLTIKSTVSKLHGCTLELKQEMYNQDDKLLAKADIQAISVNKLLKPKRAMIEKMGDIK